MLCCAVLAAGVFLSAAPSAARAQVADTERSRYGQAAYYNYSESADVTLTANVWGSVQNPGLYEVPQGTRLSELFSLAGGPALGTRTTGRRQRLVVRLSRKEPDGSRFVVFEEEMEDEVFAFRTDPVVQQGDVLTAEKFVRNRFTWRDALPFIGAATSVASTVLSIIIIQQRD